MKTFLIILIVSVLIIITFNVGHKSTGVHVGDPIMINWVPSDISSDHVQIAVMRKVNDNPTSYILVRLIENWPNNGFYTLTASTSDIGDIYVQAGCPHDIKVECASSELLGPYTIQ